MWPNQAPRQRTWPSSPSPSPNANSSGNSGAGESPAAAAAAPGLEAVPPGLGGGVPSAGSGVPVPGIGTGRPSAVGSGGQGASPSPAATPEPLTFLMVGAGLAGLYGARKHVA